MRTNVKSRLRLTAGIALALASTAVVVGFGAPASATDTTPSPSGSTAPSPTAIPEPSPSVSVEPSPSPSASRSPEPSTSPKPEPTASPSEPVPTPSCADKSVSIRGRIWRDLNKNGIQDAGEPGLPNIPLLAIDSNDVPPAQARGLRSAKTLKSLTESKIRNANPKADDDEFPGVFTDKAGKYTITGLQPGPILIALFPVTVVNDEVVEEWKITKADQGDDARVDSDFHIEDEIGFLEIEAEPCSRFTVDGGLYKDGDKPAPTATSTPAPGNGGGSLPNTGLAIGGFLLAGVALVGGGTVLTIAARRRRQIVA